MADLCSEPVRLKSGHKFGGVVERHVFLALVLRLLEPECSWDCPQWNCWHLQHKQPIWTSHNHTTARDFKCPDVLFTALLVSHPLIVFLLTMAILSPTQTQRGRNLMSPKLSEQRKRIQRKVVFLWNPLLFPWTRLLWGGWLANENSLSDLSFVDEVTQVLQHCWFVFTICLIAVADSNLQSSLRRTRLWFDNFLGDWSLRHNYAPSRHMQTWLQVFPFLAVRRTSITIGWPQPIWDDLRSFRSDEHFQKLSSRFLADGRISVVSSQAGCSVPFQQVGFEQVENRQLLQNEDFQYTILKVSRQTVTLSIGGACSSPCNFTPLILPEKSILIWWELIEMETTCLSSGILIKMLQWNSFLSRKSLVVLRFCLNLLQESADETWTP